MSKLVGIEDLTRREAIRRFALALTAAGVGGAVDRAAAQHVHHEAQREKAATGKYEPKRLTATEYATVTRLAELILPADDRSPSAVEAGAPEYIDLLCSQNDELTYLYTGGLSWLDDIMRDRHGKAFLDCIEADQVALLEELAAVDLPPAQEEIEATLGPYSHFQDYRLEDPVYVSAGVRFFDWVRKMTVDAYYTSEIGVKDLGYPGNGAYSEYTVPAEAIEYALARSPFGSGD